ncbi:hypothetical protein Tco_1461694, partial [Tanacetum coccineum]
MVEKVSEDVDTINYFKIGLLEYEVTNLFNEMNEDTEDDITSPDNEENEVDESTTPSVDINEEKEDGMP